MGRVLFSVMDREEVSASMGEINRRLASLTVAEREVLRGVLDGLSNKDIARGKGRSPRTVEGQRGQVMLKLGARNVVHLVRMITLAGY